MYQYFEGSFPEGRELSFEGAEAYMGENAACALRIPLEGSGMEGADRYFLSLEPYPGGAMISNEIKDENSEPAYVENGVIVCPLTSALTSTGSLRIQLSAVFGEKTMKSGVGKIEFGESICGGGKPFKTAEDDIFARLDSLSQRVSALENGESENPDFDFTAAAVCAVLTFESGEETPVYFEEDDAAASAKLTEILTCPDFGEAKKYTVASGSALYVITINGGAPAINAYRGREMLEYLKTEVMN